jgi:Zn-dependent protease with chaperone function
MYIVTPFKNKRKSISGLLSTHPGIDERVEALKKLK